MKLRYAVFLSLFALSIVSAAKMQNIFGRMPLCLIFSIVMFSFFYSAVVYRSFSFTENSGDKVCTREKSFHYRFSLVNDTALFFPHISAVFFNGYEKIRKDLAVKPHNSQNVELDYSFKHIGKYEAGFLSARIYDILNLFFIPYNNYRHEVLVVPRIENIDRFISIRKDDETQQSMPSFFRRNNSENFDGVRPYVPGDSLRIIHWKLTAHAGKYMSRLGENSDSMEISIFIDLFKPEYSGETALSIYDCVVESALAAANYSISQNCTAHIIFNRHEKNIVKTANNFGSLHKAAESFALCGYDASNRIESIVSGFQRTGKGLFNFVVCTPNLNYDLAYYLAGLKSLGKNPVLFYIVPQNGKNHDYDKITEYLENSGVDVRSISA